ncbi:hypothetical protein BH10PSE8_BH10PSE8_16840 [soil metagenome]
MRIERRGAGHHLEGERRLGHSAGNRAMAGDAEEWFLEARPRGERTEGRLEADEPGMGRRPPARSAGLGAERERHHPAGHGRDRPARRAARSQRRVQRMARRAMEQVGRLALGGEFRCVDDADDDRARRDEPGDGDRILRRDEIGEEMRALGDPSALHPDIVLDRNRHARERQVLAPCDALVDGFRPGHGVVGIDGNEGVERPVQLRDPAQRLGRLLPGAGASGHDGSGDLGQRRPGREGLDHRRHPSWRSRNDPQVPSHSSEVRGCQAGIADAAAPSAR